MPKKVQPKHNTVGQRRWDSISLAKRIYNSTPWYVQSIFISAYGLILHRQAGAGGVHNRQVQRYLAQLTETQWLSPSELLEIQTRKLHRLISYAYTNVPYYRQVFDDLGLEPADIREPADLQKLPLLSKQDVRQNLDRLFATDIGSKQLNYRPTSGTTGTPLPVYVSDDNEAIERALSLRVRLWSGWEAGESRATFGGYPVIPFDCQSLPLWRHDWPERRILFSSYHMTRENIGRYVQKLRSFQPKALEGYPSYLSFLARHLERMGETLPVQAVFTAAETLFPHQRSLIEERFKCPIFDWYGLTERVASAGQCEYADGYHVSAEKTIIEIIKPGGEPAIPGEYGEIVGTNLHEFGFPLIRYRTGDMSAYRPEPCPCGRKLPLIEQIQTRVDDIITTPDGRLVNPAPLAGLFRENTIEKARIIQEAQDEIVLKMVISEGYSDATSEKITEGIRTVLGPKVRVSVKLVDDIPSTASGKYPFVVSKVPLEV